MDTRPATRTLGDGTLRPPANEINALAYFAGFLDIFRAIRPTMPLQHAVAFMLVAMEEGLSVQEYAERAGVSQSLMTRHLLDIGEKNRKHEEGLGLVVQRMDPLDMRRHQTFLTPKGKALMHKIVRFKETHR